MAVIYRERLTPGPVVWLVLIGFTACVGVAYGAALGTVPGLLMGAGLTVLAVALFWFSSPVVQVSGTQVSAGQATIPLHVVSEVVELDPDAMKLARDGRHEHADARSFTIVRPWSGSTGVLLRLADPADPHPSWVVTTRRPRELHNALLRATQS